MNVRASREVQQLQSCHKLIKHSGVRRAGESARQHIQQTSVRKTRWTHRMCHNKFESSGTAAFQTNHMFLFPLVTLRLSLFLWSPSSPLFTSLFESSSLSLSVVVWGFFFSVSLAYSNLQQLSIAASLLLLLWQVVERGDAERNKRKRRRRRWSRRGEEEKSR